jgi:hypothetical protein
MNSYWCQVVALVPGHFSDPTAVIWTDWTYLAVVDTCLSSGPTSPILLLWTYLANLALCAGSGTTSASMSH